ncbi:MAG: M1 family aminopeptidase [Candidatus Eisenbacteria bacterium]
MKIPVLLPVLLLASAVLVLPGADAQSADRAPARGKTSARPSGPGFRLGTNAQPASEDVRLEIDPSQPDYRGSVSIALTLARPTRQVQLHAEDMTLESITIAPTDKDGAPGTEIRLMAMAGDHGLQTLTAPRTLRPGAYRLALTFTNDFNTQATSLYRLQAGGDWYAFTQFEADDAREAFPCFDEPEFKIPWNMTVVAPQAHVVIGNTPILSESVEAGRKTVVFQTTKPLPSYLVALATGPLETVPIEGLGVPGRVVTVKGQSQLAGEAARITPLLVSALESYFGRPYPYEKLDLIAAPEFWPGAMENAGAITFADRVLLLDPARTSVSQRRSLASTTAHELAHMWFGDLVTMRWWDDLWLNESFASWMGEKVTHQVFPEYGIELRLVSDTDEAMRIDGRLTTRAIRQPVNSMANLLQSADVLAYQKGETLLAMFEQWAGEEQFRTGVRDYLAAHAWGNATAADLFAALSRATGKDLGAPMSSFLDQAGLPMVAVEPLPGGKVRLTQKRFLPAAALRPAPQIWQVPMTLEFDDGHGPHERSVLLTQPSQVIDLGVEKIDWIEPNARAWGYYRWTLPATNMVALADDATRILSARERMEYAYNARALVDAGVMHADDYFQVLPRVLRDPEPMVVEAGLDGLEQLRDPLITPGLEEPFARYVRQALSPALARFGRAPRTGETETVALIRPRILTTLADEGRDPATRAFGDSLARAYLDDPAAVDPGLAPPALEIAALGGDAALRDRMRSRFEAATSPAERRIYLTGFSSFRDTTLVRENLAYALSGPLKPQEISVVARAINRHAPNRDLTWNWMRANYGTILKRVPPMYGAFLPRYADGCSPSRLAEADAFFAEPGHAPPGAAKELAKVAEGVEDCIGLREREGARVQAFLTKAAGQGQVP